MPRRGKGHIYYMCSLRQFEDADAAFLLNTIVIPFEEFLAQDINAELTEVKHALDPLLPVTDTYGLEGSGPEEEATLACRQAMLPT